MSDDPGATSAHADELLRARSRRLAEPIVAEPVGYPVPPRRRRPPADPRPAARDLAARDWFLAGLVLGAFAGSGLTMLFVLLVILAR